MRPSLLRPGVCVRRKGDANAEVYRFIERDAQRRVTYFHARKYEPADPGIVVISDWDMARKFERVPGPKGEML